MKEEEIRPKEIFDEYIRLAAEDVHRYFANSVYTKINCPACGEIGFFVFEKEGFNYESCSMCKTLFVSPRPAAKDFAEYYTTSASSKYWSETFYKATESARREKLWKPKVGLVSDIINKYMFEEDIHLVDIGGGYGLFAEEMFLHTGLRATIIEPGPQLAAVCRERGFKVVETFLEDVVATDLPPRNRVFVSFELFEHLHDPSVFIRHLYNLMDAGDLFIFTTLSGSGADILALGENSKSIAPPHHLNFFNPHSVEVFLKNNGMEFLEVLTPGKLDVDIMLNNKDHINDSFWRVFLDISSKKQRESMQNWLSDNLWSSHMWTVCRKPKGVL